MALEVEARHQLGAFRLDAGFACDGGLVALFGRSGSGKTTLVNVIAGLIRAETARVVLDGTVLADTRRGLFLPPHRRRIGYVFQEGRLFPHLTVRQNLLYGRWLTPARARFVKLDQVVELLGIEALLARRPARLSGGEKQRVAIGRALLASPRLLLMDEPLASLDMGRKEEILPFIERLRDELAVPIVYVSHAVAEVTRLANRVILLSEGQVAAEGDLTELMGRLDLRPLTGRHEAGAVLQARIAAHDERFRLTLLDSAAGRLCVPWVDLPTGRTLRLRIRARDVMLALTRPKDISALNVLEGSIAEVAGDGMSLAEVAVDCSGARLLARVTHRSVHDLGLAPGRPVFAVIKAVAIDRRSLGLVGADTDRGAAELEPDRGSGSDTNDVRRYGEGS